MSDMNGAAGDHKKTLKYKMALSAVIILSSLIVLALIALVVGSVMKFGRPAATAPVAAAAEFSLPEGAKILSSETQPGRLILRVQTAEGEEIDIVDTQSGKLVSRIKAPK